MKFGYTIIYVPDVAASLSFFESAFGLSRRFLHESGDYGEIESGETTLAFASCELGSMNFPEGFVAASESSKPLGIEIALVTPSVAEAAGFIEKFRLPIWRLTGPRANSGFRRVARPIRPKRHVEQTPQIAPCAAFLPIVSRNTGICRRLFHRLLYNPPCAAACRRLSSTVFYLPRLLRGSLLRLWGGR